MKQVGVWLCLSILLAGWPGRAQPVRQETHAPQSPAIHDVQGNVTILYGLSEERLIEELGVTRGALKNFFKILEQERVPPEDLDKKLREIATSYKELRRQLEQFLPEDPTVMALLRDATQALEAGDFTQVEILLSQAQARDLQAIQEQQASLKKRQLSAANTSAHLGKLKYIQLRYEEAAKHYQDAAALVPQEEAITQAAYLNNEGLAWMAAGQYAKAQPPLERALAIHETTLGPAHLDVAVSLYNLAELYKVPGEYEQAKLFHKRALDIREKSLDPMHPYIAISLNGLAELYHTEHRYAQAEPFYIRALDIWKKRPGPMSYEMAMILNNLAGLKHDQGEQAQAAHETQKAAELYAQAEDYFTQALIIIKKAPRPNHPEVAMILNNLAGLKHGQGEQAQAAHETQKAAELYAQAEDYFTQALDIRKKIFGLIHPHVASSLNGLAFFYKTQGRYAEAEPLYKQALDTWAKTQSAMSPEAALIAWNYAALLRITNRETEAAQLEARWHLHQSSRAWLGINMNISTAPPGLLVKQVTAGSPAADAGIQLHDVITRFNAHEVLDVRTLFHLLEDVPIGTIVDVEIIRTGQRQAIPVTIRKKPVLRP